MASAVNKAAIMRESALKSAIFVGVPRVSEYLHLRTAFIWRGGLNRILQVILSLTALHEALDDEVKNALRTHSRRCELRISSSADLSHVPAIWLDISMLSFISLTHISRTATSENIESTVKRGKALWNSIYTPHADKLHDKLGSYHPDFICTYTFPFI